MKQTMQTIVPAIPMTRRNDIDPSVPPINIVVDTIHFNN